MPAKNSRYIERNLVEVWGFRVGSSTQQSLNKTRVQRGNKNEMDISKTTARATGVKMVLSGEGADEIFGGADGTDLLILPVENVQWSDMLMMVYGSANISGIFGIARILLVELFQNNSGFLK